MVSKLRIGLICGGRSSEHEVSLKSAEYVIKFMDLDRFEIIVLWIDKQGGWYYIPNSAYNNFFHSLEKSNKNKYDCVSIQQIFNKFYFCLNNNINNVLKIDVVFPVTHGVLGEDGSLQGFLNILDLPYVGSGVLGSSICMNKDVTKNLLYKAGIPVTPFKILFHHNRKNIRFSDFVGIFGLPFFVKPVNQGSSIGVSLVNTNNSFSQALDIAFFYSDRVIIEPRIIGRELECAILGNYNPKSSVCGEIIINNSDFYTYKNKYICGFSKIKIPAVIDDKISNLIRFMSINAFQILNCFGMARVDLFLTSNKEDQEIVIINEVNTLPGFTSNSMYLKLWEETGLTSQFLLSKLIELALDIYNNT